MTIAPIHIDSCPIGPGENMYLIAEMSANHGKDLSVALETVHAAKEAGADAIKIQTYTADTLTMKSDHPSFQIKGGTLWDGKTLHELYEEAAMPWDWQPRLIEEAKKIGLHCFSSPFDESAIRFLEDLDVPAYKIASFELVDLPLIRLAAKTNKPLILSTGMATIQEIQDAVDAAKGEGAKEIALLKCTSAYPTLPEAMNLRALPLLQEVFQVPVGLSDHTLGITASVLSVGLGASIIEKHFTLDKKQPSPDSAFSLDPIEFKALAEAVRTAEKALGHAVLQATEAEEKSKVFRRSLFVAKDIAKGEIIRADTIRSIRPSAGIAPKFLNDVIGKKATRDLKAGTPLTFGDFE